MRSIRTPRSSSRPAGAICNATSSERFGSGTSLALAKPVRTNSMPAPTNDGQVVQDYESESSALRSEEHTSELQSLAYLVCRLLLEKKNGCSRASPLQ